jgi:hypothetical protein
MSFCIHGLISRRIEAYLEFGGGLVLGGPTIHELQCTMKKEEHHVRLANI